MSRREDIVSCIDVTMMDRSAHSALPSSYSKIFPAFRAGAAVTHAAGLGGIGFIDFSKPHACPIHHTSANVEKCGRGRHARLCVLLTRGLKDSVSTGEIG
jgi:hypothetical protein